VVFVPTNLATERNRHLFRAQADSGPELVAPALDKWVYENGVTLDFPDQENRPTIPLSSLLTAVCETSAEAPVGLCRLKTPKKIATRRQDYNHFLQHSSLDDVPLPLFAKHCYESQPSRII
jgi:putative transposase